MSIQERLVMFLLSMSNPDTSCGNTTSRKKGRSQNIHIPVIARPPPLLTLNPNDMLGVRSGLLRTKSWVFKNAAETLSALERDDERLAVKYVTSSGAA